MRILVQRVKEASVAIDNKVYSKINHGFLVLIGVKEGDTKENADFLVKKLANLRVFADSEDKMNLNIKDVNGEVLVVSQFTLSADCSKGNRPSFVKAGNPKIANELYEYFVEELKKQDINVQTGQFAAKMEVGLINDGPVTFLIEK